MAMLPYEFPKKYNKSSIKVYLDENIGLRYVLFDSKKLYFKRSWSNRKIKEYFNYLLVEQDSESPHRYLTPEFCINQNDTIIDAGAAEGIFALSVIEKTSKVYLFEPESEWVEALEATFKPWKDKIVIIPKFLGKEISVRTTTIDDTFRDTPIVDFIKIDVEGHEHDVLLGAEKTLKTIKEVKIAICTYHKQNDEIIINQHLTERGFKTSFSNGYVIFYFDKNIDVPYFRKCLLRAVKN